MRTENEGSESGIKVLSRRSENGKSGDESG